MGLILLIIFVVWIISFFKLQKCPKIGMLIWTIVYIGVNYFAYSFAIELLWYGSRAIDYAYIPGLFPAAGFVACLIKHLFNRFSKKSENPLLKIK